MKREPTHLRADARRRFARLLVPLDFTPASVRTLRYVGIVGAELGSTIYLLHVIETHPFAMTDGAVLLMKSDEESEQEATEELTRLTRDELPPELSVTPLVRRGRPALEILRAAETLRADLLIFTAHRRSTLGKWMLGSTVARIERHAQCPVVVVHWGSESDSESSLRPEAKVYADRLQPHSSM